MWWDSRNNIFNCNFQIISCSIVIYFWTNWCENWKDDWIDSSKIRRFLDNIKIIIILNNEFLIIIICCNTLIHTATASTLVILRLETNNNNNNSVLHPDPGHVYFPGDWNNSFQIPTSFDLLLWLEARETTALRYLSSGI